MREIESHVVLRSLPRDLRSIVAGWIEDFSSDPGTPAEGVYEDLRVMIFDGSNTISGIPESTWNVLKTWMLSTPKDGLLGLIRVKVSSKDNSQKLLRKATPDQIRIILEAQKEVSLDFTRLLGELTSWEADAVIKGIVLVSEVQRHTGDRHFPLREVRQAVRSHILSKEFDGSG